MGRINLINFKPNYVITKFNICRFSVDKGYRNRCTQICPNNFKRGARYNSMQER